MKFEGFLDCDEEKDVKDFIKEILKSKTEWISSGSLLVMYDESTDTFNVFTRRVQVTLTEKEKKDAFQ